MSFYKNNLLNTQHELRLLNRVTPFKINYQNAFKLQQSKTLNYTIANSLFMSKQNSKTKSKTKLANSMINNPENIIKCKSKSMKSASQKKINHFNQKGMNTNNDSSKLFKNFKNKANRLPQYNKLNQGLMRQKEQLTEKIKQLKSRIMDEKKWKSKNEQNNSLISNLIQNNDRNVNNHIQQRDKVEMKNNLLIDEIGRIHQDAIQIIKANRQVIKSIKWEQVEIKRLGSMISRLKKKLVCNEDLLGELKMCLKQGLTRMQHNGNGLKQLQNLKGEMLMGIQNEFQYNKLRNKQQKGR